MNNSRGRREDILSALSTLPHATPRCVPRALQGLHERDMQSLQPAVLASLARCPPPPCLTLAERLAADADELVLLAIELGRRQAADEPGLIRRVAYQKPRGVAQHA